MQRMLAAAAFLSARAGFSAPAMPSPIGLDPNLRAKIIPWNRVLTAAELRTIGVICDLIIPADEKSPAATAVGVPDFIDEWVSAPYPQQTADRKQLREGLEWMDAEASKRFGKQFADLEEAQHHEICADICFLPKTKPEHMAGASFFALMRFLTAGGFYTTPEGWADLGYIGNKPMAEFKGPPPEVLRHIGLA